MQIKELNRERSKAAMKSWVDSHGKLPEVKGDDLLFRETIENLSKAIHADNANDVDYYTDYHIGLGLYHYLSQQKGFSLRAAANDDFWRYTSLIIAPHIVAERWGMNNDDHYWQKGTRIWFRQMWWYTYLSWQGNLESTESVLSSENFSTDTILNLVERTGRNGTYINVYRYIMYYYSILDPYIIKDFNDRVKKYDKHATLFRTIMKLNTAKTLVIDPSLYLGGEDEFAKSLFKEAGVTI